MKRVLFTVLNVCVFMAAVFANGQSEDSNDGKSVTLEIWNTQDPATSEDAKRLVEMYKTYEEEFGIRIEHNIMVYEQLKQKVIVAGQAKNGPDVIHMLGEWVPEFASMGIISDITQDVSSWSDFSAFPESTWAVARVNGRYYGIPSVASTRVLVYREDLLKAQGLSVPKTWDDLRDVAKKLTIDTDNDGMIDQYGFAACTATSAVRGPQEFMSFLWSTGAEIVIEEDGKWVPGFTAAQAEKVFQLYYDMMIIDGSMPLFSLGWEYNELDSSFATGVFAMMQNGSWMQQREVETDKFDSWKTAPFPYDKEPATYLEVKVEGVGQFSAHKQEAVDFIKWISQRDNMVYITQSDNLPARSDAMNSSYWKDDPVWRGTFTETVKDGHPSPSVSSGPIFQKMMDYTQQVLFERITAAQAGEDFLKSVGTFLDENVN